MTTTTTTVMMMIVMLIKKILVSCTPYCLFPPTTPLSHPDITVSLVQKFRPEPEREEICFMEVSGPERGLVYGPTFVRLITHHRKLVLM